LSAGDGLLAGLEMKAFIVETQDYLGARLQSQSLAHLDRYHQPASLADSCHAISHVAQPTASDTSPTARLPAPVEGRAFTLALADGFEDVAREILLDRRRHLGRQEAGGANGA
jgi:hypothetical protein